MSRRKNKAITSDNLDSKLLFLTIIAIVITNFIVRIKVFTKVTDFDKSIIPSVSNFFTYYKLVWVLLISIILVMSLIYKMYKHKQKLELNFVLLGTGLIIIASVISFILDPIKEVSIWGLYSRSNGVLAYISLFLLIYIVSNLKIQSKHLVFLVHSINIAAIVLVTIGIFQFFGIDMMNSLWFKQIYIPSEYKHLIDNISITQSAFVGTKYFWASSLLGQFNYFGAYCSIIYPFITAFALKEDNLSKKILLILGSIMLFTGTILAQSMGSIIAMFVALLIIPIFLVNKHNYKSFLLMCTGYTIVSIIINRITNWIAFQEANNILIQVLNLKIIVLILLMSIMYIILFTFRKKLSKHRYIIVLVSMILILIIGAIGYAFVVNNISENNMVMLSGRGFIWHYSNELIKENSIIGYGPDNLYYNFPQLNPHHNILPNNVIDKPHNMYLQVWIDIGVFGIIGFMTLLVGFLFKSNKAIDIEKDVYRITYFKALMLVIGAYMIQGLVNDNHMTVQPIVYLLMGIGGSLAKQTLDKTKLPSVK